MCDPTLSDATSSISSVPMREHVTRRVQETVTDQPADFLLEQVITLLGLAGALALAILIRVKGLNTARFHRGGPALDHRAGPLGVTASQGIPRFVPGPR